MRLNGWVPLKADFFEVPLRSLLQKTPARPALPECGVQRTRLVTELFAAADSADQCLNWFFSNLLKHGLCAQSGYRG